MSTLTSINGPTRGPAVADVAVVTIRAALVALVANIIVQVLARVSGVELVLTPPGGQAIQVQPSSIVTMTLVPVVAGGLLLALLGRSGRSWTRSMAWIGLVIGLGTALMPISMGGDLAAQLTLATMHVLTGIAWFGSVRRLQRGSSPG